MHRADLLIGVENNIAILVLPFFVPLAQPQAPTPLRAPNLEHACKHAPDTKRFRENALVIEDVVEIAVGDGYPLSIRHYHSIPQVLSPVHPGRLYQIEIDRAGCNRLLNDFDRVVSVSHVSDTASTVSTASTG